MLDKTYAKIEEAIDKAIKKGALKVTPNNKILDGKWFTKLKGKVPTTPEWNKNPCEIGSASNNGFSNYGVICKDGLIVIDTDKEPLISTLQTSNPLPATYTVETRKGFHYYYMVNNVDGLRKEKLLVDNKPCGDFLVNKSQAVGEGSHILHTLERCQEIVIADNIYLNDMTGDLLDAEIDKIISETKDFSPYYFTYKSLGEDTITHITRDELDKFLAIYAPKKNPSRKATKSKTKQRASETVNVRDVCEEFDIFKNLEEKENGEYQGYHGKHPSEKKTHFTINTTKNVWSCFSCGSGGKAPQLMAVLMGKKKCDEFQPDQDVLNKKEYKEILREMEDIFDKQERYPWNEGLNLSLEEEQEPNFSDMWIARHVINDNRDDIRYSAGTKWLVFSKTHWYPNQSHGTDITVEIMIDDTVARLCKFKDKATGNFQKPFSDMVKSRGFTKSITGVLKAMTSIAVSEDISIDPADRDSHIYMLNTPKGVVDVRTGTITAHKDSKHMLITRITNANYVKGSKGSNWSDFLNKIFHSNPEVTAYLQQLAGLGCYGGVDAEIFPVMYGDGANGKSTFVGAISEALGEYSGVADTGMVSERGMKGIQGDIDMNNGKRFISISELKRGVPLSSNIVKNLTTNEPMVAKRLYCDQYLSKPSAIFFLSTNNKPKIPDTDDGTWRRLVFIPFTYIFDASAERNNNYKKDCLDPEIDAILTWVIDGFISYTKRGAKLLDRPKIIDDATSEYKEDEDEILEFMRENYVADIAKDEDQDYIYCVKVIDAHAMYKLGATTGTALNKSEFRKRLDKHPDYSIIRPKDNAKNAKNKLRNCWLIEGLKPNTEDLLE